MGIFLVFFFGFCIDCQLYLFCIIYNDIEIWGQLLAMIHAKSIKMNITNNQAHNTEVTKQLSRSSSPKQTKNNYQISEFLPVLHNDFSSQQGDANNPYVEQEEEEDYLDINNFELDPKNGKEHSMFTIRQEESYEYQSQTESICKMNKKYNQSYIDDLSTIKADCNRQNNSNHQTSKSSKISQFEPICSEKLVQNPTMTSLLKNRVLSQQMIGDRVEGWEDKISSKLSHDEEEVEQEEIVVLKQQEKGLKLNLMKMHKTGTLLKPNQKIKTGFDIVYDCSDEEFMQIRKILEKEGIKLIERNQRIRQQTDTAQKKTKKLGFKKVKLKIIKNSNNV